MHVVPKQTEALIKAMALRAFLEMDWHEITPSYDDEDAWACHWDLLQAACATEWTPEVLALTNKSWASNERFDRLEDLRRFVEKHKVAVTKSWMRHRSMFGWGAPW